MTQDVGKLRQALRGLRTVPGEARPTSLWPELHLLLAWLGMFLSFLWWFQDIMDSVDLIVFSTVSSFILPLLSRRTTMQFLGSLGGYVMGTITGLQAIDLVFDLCVIRGRSLSDGSMILEARQVAFMYYHTLLNTSHVNALLLGIVLCACLGPLMGLTRGSPEVQRRFLHLSACSGSGTSAYLFVAMPRYLLIRSAPAYYPELFDEWEKVVAARIVLYAGVVLSLPMLYRVQTMVEGSSTLSCKTLRVSKRRIQ